MPESLDPLAFRRWLEKSPDVYIGVSQSTFMCPLACWLSEVEQVSCGVSAMAYGRLGRKERMMLPSWAKRFVKLVDSQYKGCRVLRIGALSLLDRCLREVT